MDRQKGSFQCPYLREKMASALGAALESLKESNYVKYVILRSELCCAIYPTSPAAIVALSKLVQSCVQYQDYPSG